MDDSKFSAFEQVVKALDPLPSADRERLLQTLATFYQIHIFTPSDMPKVAITVPNRATVNSNETLIPQYSNNLIPTPKEFMHEKNPQSDVERVACLAYYLVHYRNQDHFKTIDITQLNTESAQRKLANTAQTVTNATSQGYLAPAPGGMRQLSVYGEKFVVAMPNRDEAKAIMLDARRKIRKQSVKKN